MVMTLVTVPLLLLFFVLLSLLLLLYHCYYMYYYYYRINAVHNFRGQMYMSISAVIKHVRSIWMTSSITEVNYALHNVQYMVCKITSYLYIKDTRNLHLNLKIYIR